MNLLISNLRTSRIFLKSALTVLFLIVFHTIVSASEIHDLTQYGPFKKIYFIPANKKNVDVRVFIPVGESDRNGAEGLSHYLEHLIASSADKAHGKGFRERHKNAWASPLWTGYWNSGPAKSFGNMIRHAGAIFQPINLTEEFMMSERDIVEREYDFRVKNNPLAKLYSQSLKHLLGKHPHGRSVMGTPASLRQISPKEALEFHRNHYSARNAYLLISGPIKLGEAIQQIKRNLSDLPDFKPPKRGYETPLPLPPENDKTIIINRLENDTANFLGLAKAPKSFSEQKLLLSILFLNDILSSSLEGSLEKPLYFDTFTTSSLSVHLKLYPNKHIGYFINLEPDEDVSVQVAVQRLKVELSALAKKGIPKETVETIKTRTLETIKRLSKQERAYPAKIAQQTILNLGYAIDVKTYEAELSQISKSDVDAILKSIAASNFSTTVFALKE